MHSVQLPRSKETGIFPRQSVGLYIHVFLHAFVSRTFKIQTPCYYRRKSNDLLLLTKSLVWTIHNLNLDVSESKAVNLRDVCPYVGKPNISTLSNDDMRVIPAKFFYKIKGFVFVLEMHYLSLFLNNMNYSSIVIHV